MATVYNLPDGRTIGPGAPFMLTTNDGTFSFAANWLELSKPADRSRFGITTSTVADPVPPTPPLYTYKTDVWLRATSDECAIIQGTLNNADPQLQGLWADCQRLEHNFALYPQLVDAFTQAFGATRAGQLLAPSEG